MLNKIMLTTVEVILLGIFVGALMAALLWADQREQELGISGLSAERILVQEEMKK